jgi:hypothetical protein
MTERRPRFALPTRRPTPPGPLSTQTAPEVSMEARPEDVVAMGDRAFLLHYRSDGAGRLLVAVGVAPAPLCRRPPGEDEQCARVVLLVVTPPRQAARYLQIVGGFARLLRQDDVLAAVHAARSPQELVDLEAFAAYQLQEQLTVRDVMSRQVMCVAPEQPIAEVASLMSNKDVDRVPVVREGQLVGFLTRGDIVRKLIGN